MISDILQAPPYLAKVLGLSLDDLLEPIGTEHPSGEDLRGTALFREIQEARRQDDPTLPQGSWERDLKKADWEKVAVLTRDAIAGKSKDLQLAAWMAEAGIHRVGFLGLAAALTLMRGLCERYWEALHPDDTGDLEHRINIFRWINDKLLPPLRLVPLTASGRDEGEYGWADWEQAGRNEQLISVHGAKVEKELGGATTKRFTAALAATPIPFHLTSLQAVHEAMTALGDLDRLLDELCGDQAPSLGAIADLLAGVEGLIGAELRRRGAYPVAVETHLLEEYSDEIEPRPGQHPEQLAEAHPQGAGQQEYTLPDRAETYTLLRDAAHHLMSLEPHSPVPYVVLQAVAWGAMDAKTLYGELFVKRKGQIDLFEVMGGGGTN